MTAPLSDSRFSIYLFLFSESTGGFTAGSPGGSRRRQAKANVSTAVKHRHVGRSEERRRLMQRIRFYEDKCYEQEVMAQAAAEELERLKLDELMYRTDRFVGN